MHYQMAHAAPEVFLHGDAHVPGFFRHGRTCLDDVAVLVDDRQAGLSAVRSGQLEAGIDVRADAAVLERVGFWDADHLRLP